MTSAQKRVPLTGPRVVGSSIVVVSVLAGGASAILISNPVLGIPAAVVLAFASVGALAGLLLLQRKDWSDRTWPPGGPDQRWNAERAHRRNIVYGVFMLVVAAAAGSGLLFAGGRPAADLSRVWILTVIFGAGGVICIVAGLRPVPPQVQSSERPAHDSSTAKGEWLQLGARRSVPVWRIAGTGALGYSRLQAPMMLAVFLPLAVRLGSWFLALAVAVAVAGAAVAYLMIRRARSPALVSRDGSTARWGGRDVAAADIVSASLLLVPWTPDATERSLALVLESSGGLRSTVGLRRRGRLVLTDVETAALARLVSKSSIDLPRDRDDPKGKFSRVLYPSNLTKSETLVLVEHPPGDGEPLPITQPPPVR